MRKKKKGYSTNRQACRQVRNGSFLAFPMHNGDMASLVIRQAHFLKGFAEIHLIVQIPRKSPVFR
jgi:hypothetical protein